MALRLGVVLLAAIAIMGTALWLVRERDGGAESHIAVADAWTRPAAEADGTAAVYLRIENTGDAGDRLTDVETPVAAKAEMHSSRMEGDIMRMRPVDSIEILAGKRTDFAPGGLHIMLTGLKQSLKEGDRFPLTLVFDRAGRIGTEVIVHDRGPAAAGQGGMGGMHESQP